MYELYVSLRTRLRFVFFSESPPGALFFAVFLAADSAGALAGAFEATLEAGAFPAVEAGYSSSSAILINTLSSFYSL